MLQIAIVESEAVAKDYVFAIGQLLHDYAWNFTYLTSIMDFFKEQQSTSFDIVILNEKFDTNRIHEALIKEKPYTVIFSCDQPKTGISSTDLFYMNRMQVDKKQLEQIILPVVKQQEDFFFSYNGVKVMMKINDIQYIEKQDKFLIYHTSLGEFKERANMSNAIQKFTPYGFLHIHVSYLINGAFLKGLDGDEAILKDRTRIPISRSKYRNVKDYLYQKRLSK